MKIKNIKIKAIAIFNILFLSNWILASPSEMDHFWKNLKSKNQQELVNLTQSTIWYHRVGALLALENKNLNQAIIIARDLLNDRALLVRFHAAKVLLKSNNQYDIELIINEMNQPRNFLNGKSLFIRKEIIKDIIQKKANYISLLKEKMMAETDSEIKEILRKGE